MSIYSENKTFIAQLFKQRNLIPFTVTQDQLNVAKQSLIFKKKCNSNVHSLLFCKSFATSTQFLATKNQMKILDQEKSKYFEYVRKTYKDKIPEEFQTQNKLRKTLRNKLLEIKQNENKNQDDLLRKRQRQQSGETIKKVRQEKVPEVKKNKKLKSKNEETEKKKDAKQEIIGIQSEVQDNFESEVDLHNDQIQQSFDDQQA